MMTSFWSASTLKGEINLEALIPNLLLKINKLLLFNLIESIQYFSSTADPYYYIFGNYDLFMRVRGKVIDEGVPQTKTFLIVLVCPALSQIKNYHKETDTALR